MAKPVNNQNNQRRGGRRGSRREERDIDSRLLDVARVTRVVAGGRRFRFRTLVAVVDKKGRLGVGIAKAGDVSSAIEKANLQAKKNLMEIPLVKGTISRELVVKHKSAKLMLRPRKKGLMAGGVIRQMAKLAKIENLTAKVIGSKNKVANANCFMKALKELDNTKAHIAKKTIKKKKKSSK